MKPCHDRRGLVRGRAAAVFSFFSAAAALLAGFAGTAAAQDRSITIKLATRDSHNDWPSTNGLKRFAASDRQDLANGRIQVGDPIPQVSFGAISRA